MDIISVGIGLLVGMLAMCVLVCMLPGIVFALMLVVGVLGQSIPILIASSAVGAFVGAALMSFAHLDPVHGAAYGAVLGAVGTVLFCIIAVCQARW
jgi:hypothetical protein